MKTLPVIIIAVGMSVFLGPATAQYNAIYQANAYIHRGDTLPYRILYPSDYNADTRYPVLFFLHGAGERGNDNQRQLTHGGNLFLADTFRLNHPAIIIFPQCPADSYWANVTIESKPEGGRSFYFDEGGRPTKAMSLLLRLIDQVVGKETVDNTRIYIGGLSMGGMGTYEALRRRPQLFAAAFAICGGDNSENVAKYAHIPLWIFHGEKDDVVPADHSHMIVDQLHELGASPRYTFYPQANHNSWDSAFAEPALIPWLFSQKKK